MVPSPAGSMGKDRIRMTRDKYILHGHWAGWIYERLKNTVAVRKGDKNVLFFHAKTVSLNETEGESDSSSQSEAWELIK